MGYFSKRVTLFKFQPSQQEHTYRAATNNSRTGCTCFPLLFYFSSSGCQDQKSQHEKMPIQKFLGRRGVQNEKDVVSSQP